MTSTFTEQIRDIFQQQRERILASSEEGLVDAAFAALEAKRLDPESIDRDCCAQLKIILKKRYDVPQPSSTRLDKYGWSAANVRAHMTSFLKHKLQLANRIIREFMNDPDNAHEQVDAIEPEIAPEASQDTFAGEAWHHEQTQKDEEPDTAPAPAAAMASTLDDLVDDA